MTACCPGWSGAAIDHLGWRAHYPSYSFYAWRFVRGLSSTVRVCYHAYACTSCTRCGVRTSQVSGIDFDGHVHFANHMYNALHMLAWCTARVMMLLLPQYFLNPTLEPIGYDQVARHVAAHLSGQCMPVGSWALNTCSITSLRHSWQSIENAAFTTFDLMLLFHSEPGNAAWRSRLKSQP